MVRKATLLFLTLILCSTLGFAQGLDTTASKDDWEEINFEFDSSILSDGYPSLLRLAELLSENSDYAVELTGHTDFRGSDEYNLGLGRRRADTVKAFLLKYGALDGQITIKTAGEEQPEVPNETDEGRFMNRRVVMSVRDGSGQLLSDGGVGDAIEGIEKLVQAQQDCCNQILEKLSKLDEILDLLKGLQEENDKLKQDVADLKNRPAPKMPEITPAPTVAEVADAVEKRLDKPSNKYASFNLNAGPSSMDGNLSASGQGRVFVPFGGRHAIQAQGEYMHYLGRDEGQVDLGLVSRWGNVQLGGFSSFKQVKFAEWQSSGGLGQAAATLDYVFGSGRVGIFGTKGFMEGAVVNEAVLRRNVTEQTYLDVVDQFGFSTAVSAWNVGGDKYSWFEGNVGALFRESGGNRPGGTIRYVHPLTQGIALTLEGGLNETFITSSNEGRFVVGLQFGDWLSPRKYKDMGHKPVPVDIPRVRYEVLKRQIRTGNDAPTADAGPDQLNIQPGEVVRLNGSGSFDPDGDPITFQWAQVGGPSVALSGTDTEFPTFTAREGEIYHFRLTVRDDQGGIDTDRTTVGAVTNQIRILRFSVEPTSVDRGDSVTISWDVENADGVTIEPGLGRVDSSGSSTVQVFDTTDFVLQANKAENVVTETRTVRVNMPQPKIVSFLTTPATIQKGDTSILSWDTLDADQVTIDVQSGSGTALGSVGAAGSTEVSPEQTTTYKITATNTWGSVTRTVTLTVLADPPRILNFVATPQEIDPGEFSTLVWEVENATAVVITPEINRVDPVGTADVQPMVDTTYTLTASNDHGEVSATVIVGVRNQVRILSFQADKTLVKNPGDPATLSWVTENAERVVLLNIGDVDPTGSAMVNPVGETVYTLTAYGENSSVSATVLLVVENANRTPIAEIVAPSLIQVPAGTLSGTTVLDGTRSRDPDGDPITFQWNSVGAFHAVVQNPTSPTPTVEFLGGYGKYEFELMVTDDKGAMGTARKFIFWIDP